MIDGAVTFQGRIEYGYGMFPFSEEADKGHRIMYAKTPIKLTPYTAPLKSRKPL